MSITCPVCKANFILQEKPKSATENSNILELFPETLRAMIEVNTSHPKFTFLKIPYVRGEDGKQNWVTINQIIKDNDGKWISAGADSHWELPKK